MKKGPLHSLARLDAHLHDPVKTPAVTRRVRAEGQVSPADEFNSQFSEQEILEWMEFSPAYADHQGEHWVRAGKDPSQGSSATVYSDDEGTHVTIWSETVATEWPGVEVRRPYDAYGLFVHAFHKGDFYTAAGQLADEGFISPLSDDRALFDLIIASVEAERANEQMVLVSDEEIRTSWEPVDGRKLMTGPPPPGPEHLARVDGEFMLYPGKVHGFYGEPESMKSWGAHVAIAQALEEEKDCLLVDFENQPRDVYPRLFALGVDPELAYEHLKVIAPTAIFSPEAQGKLAELLSKIKFAIAVVDGVTDAMALMGLDPEKNKDASVFDHQLLRPLARNGAAVVVIDHVAKNSESRGRWAIGAQHKQAAITGAALTFEIVKPFGHQMTGIARVVIKKDKPGHLRRLALGDRLFELWMQSNEDGTITHALRLPTAAGDDEAPVLRPSMWMERICQHVYLNPGITREDTFTALAVKNDDSWSGKAARLAWDILVEEKFIREDMHPNRWRVETMYVEADDPNATPRLHRPDADVKRSMERLSEMFPSDGAEKPATATGFFDAAARLDEIDSAPWEPWS